MLISRFISCSRKSSFRPHGSSASESAVQWARCARNRVTSSLMSERPTVRTISWAIAVRSTGSSAVSSAMRAASRSCSDVWPFAAASAIRSMSVAEPTASRLEILSQMRPFVNPHPLERRHRALDQFGQPRGQLRLVRLGHLAGLLANRHRVRKPQQIARRQLTADDAARPRTLECLLQRRHERLVQLHLRQRARDATACSRSPRPVRARPPAAPAPRMRCS